MHAVLARELELHRQIHGAIWAAVAAMERWSGGVARWQGKATRELNAWLAAGAQSLADIGVDTPCKPLALPAPPPPPAPRSGARGGLTLRPDAAMRSEFGATVMIAAGSVRGAAGLPSPSHSLAAAAGESRSASPLPAAAGDVVEAAAAGDLHSSITRPGSAARHSNRVMPATGNPAAAAAGSRDDGPVTTLVGVARIPTMSGKSPNTHLAPLE